MADNGPKYYKVLALTLGTRVVLAITKLIVFSFTGFLFLLGEALNNITDIVVVLATIFGVKFGTKGGDHAHPFGHRRLQSIVSLIIAVVFIAVTSYQLIRTAIPKLFNPPALTGDPYLAFYVIVGSFVINLIPLPFLLKKENREDISLKTELFDTINDGLSLMASMAGLGLIYFGFPLGDPIATIIIALIIAFDALLLIRENTNVLLGQSPDDKTYEEVRDIVLQHDKVLGIHDMIAEYIGPNVIHMDFDMEMDPETTLAESDEVVREVKSKLRKESSREITVSIHPCSHRGDTRRIHSNI